MNEQSLTTRAPLPPARHALACGCFACAEWRAEMRRRGWQTMPARDWRGVEFAV